MAAQSTANQQNAIRRTHSGVPCGTLAAGGQAHHHHTT